MRKTQGYSKSANCVSVHRYGYAMLYILALWYCFLSTPFLAQAQEPQPIHLQFDYPAELPSSETYQVRSDSKGMIWIATDRGAVRYDGNTFQTFDQDDGLEDPVVFCMTEDDQGRMWFASYSGRIFYFQDERFHPHPENDLLDSAIVKHNITSLAVRNDSVWLGLEMVGFLAPDGDFKFFQEEVNQNTFFHQRIGDQAIFGSHKSKVNPDEFLWINCNVSGACDSFRISAPRETYIGSPWYFQSMVQTSDTTILASFSNVLVSVDFNQQKVTKLLELDQDYGFTMAAMCIDAKGNRWICTNGKGVYKFNAQNEIIGHYFDGFSFSSIDEDQEGGIWISSLQQGLFYFPNPAITFWSNEDLPTKGFLKSVKHNSKEVYLTSSEGNLISLNIEKLRKRQSHFFQYTDTLSGPRIAYIDSTQLLLHTNSGIFRLRDFQISKVSSKRGYHILTSPDGLILVSRVIFNLEKGRESKQKVTPKGHRITMVQTDSLNQLWIGSVEGLLVTDTPHFEKPYQEVLSGKVNFIKAQGNNLLVGTMQKAYVIDLLTHKVRDWNLAPDQVGNSVSAMHIHKNRLFVASVSGLSIFDLSGPKPEFIQRIDRLDGLSGGRFLDLFSVGDSVLLVGDKGISIMPAHIDYINRFSPPIKLDSFAYRQGQKLIRFSANSLNHDENNILVYFTGTAFRNGQNIEYKYRLIGLDSNYQYTRDRKAAFSALPAGKYTFEVYAANNQGYWSDQPATISFEVHPPFWLTWWFISGLTILVLAGASLLIRYQMRETDRKRSVQLRLLESEQKSLQAQMNPHFLYNSLNSAQYQITTGSRSDAADHLARFSILMRKVLQNNRVSMVSIREELDMLDLYLQLEQSRLMNSFSFQLDLQDKSLENVRIPTMIVQPFVENAVWHGIASLKTNGMIKISVMEDNHQIVCIIEDNGIGRQAAERKKPKGHQSTGIPMIKQRIDILNERYGTKAYDLHITDAVVSPTQPGTKVILKMLQL